MDEVAVAHREGYEKVLVGMGERTDNIDLVTDYLVAGHIDGIGV